MAAPRKNEADKAVKQTISMTPEQHEKLVEFCQQIERSMSYVIRKALDEYMVNHADDKPFEEPFDFKW